MENGPVSAAIVTYNDGEKAEKAVRCLLENTKKYPLKLYVFDNLSTDGTAERVEKAGAEVIRLGKNIGFGAAHNKALPLLCGKYHFIVNPDITFRGDLLSDIVDFMEQNPDVVLMMPQIIGTDGKIQHLPKEVPTFKRLFLGRLSKKVRREFVWADREIKDVTDIDFCSGCFCCVKSEVFKTLGGFDERYFMYLEDADLSLSAKKHGRVVINPEFEVVHEWERKSAKSVKYLCIHTSSAFKFLKKKGKKL